jgi:hypothetical protein
MVQAGSFFKNIGGQIPMACSFFIWACPCRQIRLNSSVMAGPFAAMWQDSATISTAVPHAIFKPIYA